MWEQKTYIALLFQGYVFTVGTLTYEPFVYKQPDSSYYGLEFIMTDAIASLRNFR